MAAVERLHDTIDECEDSLIGLVTDHNVCPIDEIQPDVQQDQRMDALLELNSLTDIINGEAVIPNAVRSYFLRFLSCY